MYRLTEASTPGNCPCDKLLHLQYHSYHRISHRLVTKLGVICRQHDRQRVMEDRQTDGQNCHINSVCCIHMNECGKNNIKTSLLIYTKHFLPVH